MFWFKDVFFCIRTTVFYSKTTVFWAKIIVSGSKLKCFAYNNSVLFTGKRFFPQTNSVLFQSKSVLSPIELFCLEHESFCQFYEVFCGRCPFESAGFASERRFSKSLSASSVSSAEKAYRGLVKRFTKLAWPMLLYFSCRDRPARRCVRRLISREN